MEVASTYISQITEQVNLATASCGRVLLFGENINTGSRIGGLARGLTVNPDGKILNVGNCELTHCGVGMGIMMDGGNSVLFMKQLDFLLLGLDHLINTYNFIRAYDSNSALGSFTVYPIVCDQGYQGPQSSFNSAGDIASLANVGVYCLNTVEDAAVVIKSTFVAPGFRIICTSQRFFDRPALSIPVLWRAADHSLFQFSSGDTATVICYNFALRHGLQLLDKLRDAGVTTDLFHSNFVPGMNLERVIESCCRTGKLVILDDSKTVTKFSDRISRELQIRNIPVSIRVCTRDGCAQDGYGVGIDEFNVNVEELSEFITSMASHPSKSFPHGLGERA